MANFRTQVASQVPTEQREQAVQAMMQQILELRKQALEVLKKKYGARAGTILPRIEPGPDDDALIFREAMRRLAAQGKG